MTDQKERGDAFSANVQAIQPRRKPWSDLLAVSLVFIAIAFLFSSLDSLWQFVSTPSSGSSRTVSEVDPVSENESEDSIVSPDGRITEKLADMVSQGETILAEKGLSAAKETLFSRAKRYQLAENFWASADLYTAAGEVFLRAGERHFLSGSESGSGGKEISSLLEAAVSAYNGAMGLYDALGALHHWAAVQNNRGSAYKLLGELSLQNDGGKQRRKEASQYLKAALASFDSALDVYEPGSTPQQWAAVQFNRGVVLYRLGQLERDSFAAIDRYEASVMAFDTAAQIRNRQDFPEKWADLQANRGRALYALGSEQGGAEALSARKSAVVALGDAFAHYKEADSPIPPEDLEMLKWDYARALLAVGKSADEEAGIEPLTQARQLLEELLAATSQEEDLQRWAELQSRLAHTLFALGERLLQGRERIEVLGEAASRYNSVLDLITQEQDPALWGASQFRLGSVLLLLGGEQRRKEDALISLAQARLAFDQAMKVYDGAGDMKEQDVWLRIMSAKGLSFLISSELNESTRWLALLRAQEIYSELLGSEVAASNPEILNALMRLQRRAQVELEELGELKVQVKDPAADAGSDEHSRAVHAD